MVTVRAALSVASLPPTRQALLDRITEAARALVGRASDEDILAAIAAPTGSTAIAQLVGALPDDPTAPDDPLAKAYAGAAAWRHAYAQAVTLLSAQQAQAALGLKSSEALRKRDRAGTILALPLATGKFAYPAWQFVDGRVVGGLAAVREALGTPNGWAYAGQLDGICLADGLLAGQSLRDLLLAGHLALAVQTAAAAAESGGA